MINREVYEDYIEQSSWLSTNAYQRLFKWLDLNGDSHVLDVACGSGGPTIRMARVSGCSVVGIDVNDDAIASATALARSHELAHRVRFECIDGNLSLPFDDEFFDTVVCFDAIPLMPDRRQIIGEWKRVLKFRGRLLYTGPVVTGPISNIEIAERTAQGEFVLVPPEYDVGLLEELGFAFLRQEDLTAQLAEIAGRYIEVRTRHAKLLREREGAELFEKENSYRKVAESLAKQRRLSHFAFMAQKR